MSHISTSRRRFLSFILGLGALALIGPVGRLFGFVRVRAGDRPGYGLGDFFKHPKSAEVVGQAYLEQAPEERDLNVLLDRIFEGATDRRSEFAAAGTGRRRAILLEQTRDDFARGRTAKIDGWILSVTEARLCALSVLPGIPG